MEQVEQFNQQFGIPGQVTFTSGPGELVQIRVTNALATAEIALLGGQVMAFCPKGQQEVLWVSPTCQYGPGLAMRGGIPVCWPWFGRRTEPQLPPHGFVRTMNWEVRQTAALPDGQTRVVLGMKDDETTRSMWPYAFDLSTEVTVGASLRVALIAKNLSAETVRLTGALHTYFKVSDLASAQVLGLDGTEYLDTTLPECPRKIQQGAVRFEGEVDRVFLNTTADCLLVDSGLKRQVRISKTGSHSSVVWNPGAERASRLADVGPEAYRQMVCVETANARLDTVDVAPQAEHRLETFISVEPL